MFSLWRSDSEVAATIKKHLTESSAVVERGKERGVLGWVTCESLRDGDRRYVANKTIVVRMSRGVVGNELTYSVGFLMKVPRHVIDFFVEE
jgi:hypothetical protein